jgi:two-component system CheB/CheR fusion protein
LPIAQDDTGQRGSAPPDELNGIELSAEVRAELLDPESWGIVLEEYARTAKLAVALTDIEGHLLGTCYNPQPVWILVRNARPEWGAGCSFCLPPSPCTAVADALRTAHLTLVHDRGGLAHVAVPLSLGDQHLGALIAGQVFDRHPESLPSQRVARDFGLSAQGLLHLSGQQAPMSQASLTVYGHLLRTLGHAFLRQRYGAIVERKLVETNRRFRLLVEGVKDYALFTVDAAGRVSSWNSGAERLLGYTEAEMVGRGFSRIFTPEDVHNGVPGKELQEATSEGRADAERWHLRKDGSRIFVTGVLASLGQGDSHEFGKIIRDVTEQRKTEAALLQAQKLESLGVLAGGIAHDFNNLLTGILGNASLVLDNVSPRDPDRPMLEDIVASSKRAAALTNQLLAYAGKGQFVITRFDLFELILEMLHLIEASIPKTVRLQFEPEPDLPLIEADASQIQQIVMNLVINAAEAIGAEGGTIRVSTGVADTAAADSRKPGRSVSMEVRDSGSGMDEVTRAKIFDPFFTTKFTGRGLGLAAVSGIIRGHKGRIEVESVPGEGTTFRVFLPALAADSVKTEKVPSSPDLQSTGAGRGAILVADDEGIIRRLTKAALEHRGYAVLLAENGIEAVTIFQQRAAEITGVLLDMTMPIMGGEEALRRIREIRPDVPVLVASGYSEIFTRERLGDTVNVSFIQKPYTVMQLAGKIKALFASNDQ